MLGQGGVVCMLFFLRTPQKSEENNTWFEKLKAEVKIEQQQIQTNDRNVSKSPTKQWHRGSSLGTLINVFPICQPCISLFS